MPSRTSQVYKSNLMKHLLPLRRKFDYCKVTEVPVIFTHNCTCMYVVLILSILIEEPKLLHMVLWAVPHSTSINRHFKGFWSTSFYRPDVHTVALPTVSKHWRQSRTE